MKKKIFLLLFCLSCFNAQYLSAKNLCWGGDEWMNYRLFHPEVVDLEEYKPFFFSFDRLYDYTWDEPAYKYRDNITEWRNYFGGTIPKEDIDSLLYSYSLKDIQQFWMWVKDDTRPRAEKILQNKMANYLHEHRAENICMIATDYLMYAKRCEPHANWNSDPWSETPYTQDEKAMKDLILEGEKRCTSLADPFIKVRYGFQAVRLAHYMKDFSKCITLYDKLVEPIKTESIIKYWALGQKGGALKGNGKSAEANYIFAKVFDKCASKRVNMYLSYQFNTDADWTSCMNLCKTPREKTTMFLMRAINPDSKTTEELENIYQLDPQSEYLTLLLTREVNKIESQLMGYDFNFKYPIEIKSDEYASNEEALRYLPKLKEYVSAKIQEGKVKDLGVWKLVEGYLYFLEGNFSTAQKLLSGLNGAMKTNQQKAQLKNFLFLLKVAQINKVDVNIENEIYGEYQKIDFLADEYKTRTMDCIEHVFQRAYERQGQKGKAFLCTETGYELLINPEISVVDDLLKLADNSKSSFELYLLKKIDGTSYKDVLLDMKGTDFLRNHQLTEARNYFKQFSPLYLGNERALLYSNPFNGLLFDCQECAYEKYGDNNKFTKLWAVEKMLEMENAIKTETDQNKIAENYYLLANAWYNFSYYGVSWKGLAFHRYSSSAEVYYDENNVQQPDNELTVRDMDMPLAYYQKAAAATSDKELKAKCAFMMAKCAQNKTYSGSKDEFALRNKFFQQLKQSYSDTQYYKEVLRECSYFQYFVTK